MENILNNLSSTLHTLKSRYARDNGGGGGGGGSTVGKRDHDDDEMLGEKGSSENDHNDHNDRSRSVVSESSLRKGWLRYPGWWTVHGRKKWVYHFGIRCVLLFLVILVGLSIMDWVEQRRVIQAVTGLRGLTPSQTEALKKRTWKKYFMYQGIRSLMVSMVIIVVLCLWMDPLTIP